MDALPYILKVLYVISIPVGIFLIIFKLVSYIDSKYKNRISVGVALLNYLICIALFLISIKANYVFDYKNLDVVPLVLYFACGIYLNRIVLRRVVEWHPYLSTLEGVSQAKLFYMILWPLEYLCLFIRLAINKLL